MDYRISGRRVRKALRQLGDADIGILLKNLTDTLQVLCDEHETHAYRCGYARGCVKEVLRQFGEPLPSIMADSIPAAPPAMAEDHTIEGGGGDAALDRWIS